MSINYSIILEPLRKILAKHEFLFVWFEDKLKSVLHDVDVVALLSGSISQKALHLALVDTLQALSAYALEEYERTNNLEYRSISDMVWNPINAAFLKLPLLEQKPSVKENSSTSNSNKDTKSLKSSRTLNPSVNVAPELDEDERQRLYDKILATRETREVLYRTKFHSHVKCEEARCKYCTHLFNTLNLTKCIGHAACSKTGWYPHVGASLWKMVKTKHNSRSECTLVPKACKAHELPSLSTYKSVSQLPDTHVSKDADPSSPSNEGIVRKSVKRQRNYSPVAEQARPGKVAEAELSIAELAEKCIIERRRKSDITFGDFDGPDPMETVTTVPTRTHN